MNAFIHSTWEELSSFETVFFQSDFRTKGTLKSASAHRSRKYINLVIYLTAQA